MREVSISYMMFSLFNKLIGDEARILFFSFDFAFSDAADKFPPSEDFSAKKQQLQIEFKKINLLFTLPISLWLSLNDLFMSSSMYSSYDAITIAIILIARKREVLYRFYVCILHCFSGGTSYQLDGKWWMISSLA